MTLIARLRIQPEELSDLANPPSRRPKRRFRAGEKRDLRIGRLLFPESFERPTRRSQCVDGVRPCPYVGCRHHLFLEVTRTGTLIFRYPDLEPWELNYSCSLDVADAVHVADEVLTQDVIGALTNVSRQRAQQIEESAVARANAKLARLIENPFT